MQTLEEKEKAAIKRANKRSLFLQRAKLEAWRATNTNLLRITKDRVKLLTNEIGKLDMEINELDKLEDESLEHQAEVDSIEYKKRRRAK